MKPLFEYILEPSKIEFEDDIVLIMKQFIKKTRTVSSTMWTIYPHLMKVFQKNKMSFGNLLDTLNMFLVYGKQDFVENKNNLPMLIEMGKLSMFSTEANVAIMNSEGCIFYQLLF